ncbi:hypothetical protein [Kitasatospora sp. A2-31]|uniref:hypothetical protein n=1 Tax=Kitasatospora sp. A2-31 TaxID=2916414 RepID=UPI001EEB84F2|nr:hypothetical protein [Kitasatospora sp. A2-31]MCG6495172.1 hypothetical protein [Kitasatospora sp. A2-31]
MLIRPGRRPRPWPADDRWDTWPVRARVLAVSRTLTSATRVLEVLSLLRGQRGIRCYLTVNPGSAFAAGLDDHLRGIPGVTLLTWQEATRYRFDLAVACAVHSSMHRLHAPLVVLPHGAGYNRLVPESTGDTVSTAGLSRNELTHRGRVFPAVVGLSHREQFRRLERSCPEALPRAREIGDLSYDRMVVSLGSRDAYRAALGAVDGRRLVVVSSTWSAHSLAGRDLDLPLRLVGRLPADEYTVAVVLHPNIWARHDPRALFDAAARAGLRLIPPHQGWQAALVAADCLIGDHGSVSFYGAALGRPILLAATGATELDPHSPTHAFGRAAPALDPAGDLLAQVEAAIADHDPAALRAVTDLSLGHRGRSAAVLRDVLRSYLPEIDEPDEEPGLTPHPVPVPSAAPAPTAYRVTGHVTGTEVRLRRYPVGPDRGPARGFLSVSAEEPRPALRRSAEVLARTTVRAEQPAEHWLAATLAGLPGLTVATAALGEARHLLRLRTGLLLEARAEAAWGTPAPRLDPLLLGAAVALQLAGGGEPAGLGEQGLTLRTGGHRTRVTFHPRPEPDS